MKAVMLLSLAASACVPVGESELTLDEAQACILVEELLKPDPIAAEAAGDPEAEQARIDELTRTATRLPDDLAIHVEVIAEQGLAPASEAVKGAQEALAQWSTISDCNASNGSADPQVEDTPGTADPISPSALEPADLEPALLLLAEACTGGILDACDDLWLWAEAGSESELIGATCGARSEVRLAGSCSVSFDPDSADRSLDREEGLDSAATTSGTDPGFDVLRTACRDEAQVLEVRDAACELLYLTAPVESEYESEALSCGGRSERLVFRPCSELDEQQG